MDPNSPEVASAMQEASLRINALHRELLEVCPALGGSMAIPGMYIGHGLGGLVANGMTDDQIVTHVLVIVTGIRRELGKVADG